MSKNKIFGLDISDHSLEALWLKKSRWGKPKVIAYARTILRGEIVRNGIIKQPEKLAENIVKLLASAKPKTIKTPYCILSLPDSQIFTAVFKVPAGLRQEEIKNTIPYQAEEVIPFKSSEIYFDFKPITKEGSTQEVFYAAIPAKVVDSYRAVLEQAGLLPVAFDLESISLARAALNPLSINKTVKINKQDSGVLLIDIGARTTNFSIFDRNGIRQNLTVPIAGARFTKSLALDLKITIKEAEALKIKSGLDPKSKQPAVVSILQKEIDRLVVEAKKLIDYYQNETGRLITQVVLAGGSSLLPKIDEYFAQQLNLPASRGNILAKVSDLKGLLRKNPKAILFANVIGLGLRGTTKDVVSGDINLLPISASHFSLTPQREDRSAWHWVYFRLAVLAVLAGLLVTLVILKNRGFDPYQEIYPTPQYETNFSLDIDGKVLDELRAQFLLPPESTTTPTTTSALELPLPENKVLIKSTSVGYIKVRQGPGTNYPKIGQADSGSEYVLLEEQGQWYKIKLETGEGWVSAVYVDKLK